MIEFIRLPLCRVMGAWKGVGCCGGRCIERCTRQSYGLLRPCCAAATINRVLCVLCGISQNEHQERILRCNTGQETGSLIRSMYLREQHNSLGGEWGQQINV